MLERFFFTKQGDFHPQEADPITLLSGPPSSGKTSLLFQFAVNSASQCRNVNSKVVFICSRRRLETKPPYLAQAYIRLSTYHYILYINDDDDEGIKKYFAAFHLKDTFPIAVVVDDFGDFFLERSCQERYGNPRGRDLAMVRTLALCHNAIIFANKTGPCRLLLSDTHSGDSPRSLFIYKRWIRTIFTVKGDDSGSFCLKYNKYSESGSSKGTKTAKYSVAFQYLLLEGITEVDDEQ
ncbi:tRNA dimethylallyltransferase [Gossypium australe]|uniref:tRNA dimethylallyltransferase n=1 Tax=Gossypium australe TaxID=47621 RepID=A0A5B6VA86_9ROSI|nr:tRNA dimethylallyltransferase [Gossypium australe]